MKRSIIVMFLALLYLSAGCPTYIPTLIIVRKACFKPLETLSISVAWVESSNNPNALNRTENAIGLFQIRTIRLKDYNQRNGTHYKMKDCYDPQINKMIWLFYASKFYPTDYEGVCKAWNGRGKSNRDYWAKVKKRLEKDAKNPLK